MPAKSVAAVAASTEQPRDSPMKDSGPLAGRLGLRNMGNTCFMNTGLQCIAHLEPVAEYFLHGAFSKESERLRTKSQSSSSGSSDPGTKGELTNSFILLMKELWQCGGAKKSPQKSKRIQSILPKNFYDTFKKLRPFLFEDDEQQDVQEFIGFCLEGLNEDLNRVSQLPSHPTDAQIKEDERVSNEEGDDFAAALSWYRHLEREKSFFVDILQGQLRSSVTCQQCGHMSQKFEPFMHLSIPVEKSMNCLTDGISKYLEEEHLCGDEQWHCEKCKTKVDATKKIDLWFLPPVLILHLKRFDASLTKIDKRLHMSVCGFNLTECCSRPQKDGAVYDVACVANHQGAYGSGHYTAICRVGPPSSGTWHMYDDETVTELKDSRSVATKQAYVVFLVRQGNSSTARKASDCIAEAASVPDRRRMLPRCQSVTNPDDWPHASESAKRALEIAKQSSREDQASEAAGGDTPATTESIAQVAAAASDANHAEPSSDSATLNPVVSAATAADSAATDSAVQDVAVSMVSEPSIPASSSADAKPADDIPQPVPEGNGCQPKRSPILSVDTASTAAPPANRPYAIGQKVQHHDGGEDWKEGFVTCIHPLLVTKGCDDLRAQGYEWYEVRHIPEAADRPSKEKSSGRSKRQVPAVANDTDTVPDSKPNESGISAKLRHVFTPARRSRSETDDAEQAPPKRQRSILDLLRASKESSPTPAPPKPSRSIFDFFQRR